MHHPVNWLRALRREAQAFVSHRAPPTVRFGFPQSDAFAPAPRPQSWDGWDYAATHRITFLPPAGLAIALNDHCTLVFIPLPMVGCALGKIPVSGDLFKHLRIRASGRLP